MESLFNKRKDYFFNLFSNCFVVEGYKKAVIMDLSKNSYLYIPKTLCDIILKSNKLSVSNIKKDFNNLFDYQIDAFFNNLILKGVGFYTPDNSGFSNLKVNWEVPYIISNTSIMYSNLENLNNLLFLIDIIETDCLSIVIKKYSLKLINWIATAIKQSKFQSLQLYLYQDIDNIEYLTKLFEKLTHIYIFNSKENKIIGVKNVYVIYTTSLKVEGNQIDLISKNKFLVNIPLFTESQKYNTYFNRKLHVDINGRIKNTPECKKYFGNIHAVKSKEVLINIIDSKAFQKYWHVNKELIDVCKHCEYRHMCVDNRVPLKRNEREWFMETECNYNPYIAKWVGEDGYKTLSECGITSNQDSFKINRKKLNAINKELLGND